MKPMREVLRRDLGRSLKGLPELDRLRAAWTVACGRAMAERGEVTGIEGGIAVVEAQDEVWLAQMLSMRRTLERELASIAEVRLNGIHFCLKANS